MTLRILKSLARWPGHLTRATSARLLANTRRAPRFCGIYPTRETATAAIPANALAGYDNEGVADVSWEHMCQRQLVDYPLIFWLQKLLPDNQTILDVGGHMGTKFMAFQDILPLKEASWSVVDLPEIIRSAQDKQAAGLIPSELEFRDNYPKTGITDILICSGLFQYFPGALSDLLKELPENPPHILLNKVALTQGQEYFTLERIGAARVPYHVRNEKTWYSDLSNCGYEVADFWEIPELSHQISTHPWAAPTKSIGMYLRTV